MLKQRAGLHQAPCSAKLACLGEPSCTGKLNLPARGLTHSKSKSRLSLSNHSRRSTRPHWIELRPRPCGCNLIERLQRSRQCHRLGYPDAGRRKSEGPGRFLARTPGLLHAGARAKRASSALPLCPRCTALSSPTWNVHRGARSVSSAVQLRALREASADLPPLRPRQPVLRRNVRRGTPARVVIARRSTLSAQPAWSVPSRGAPARLARPAST
jgi:hypothetical protein